MKQHTPIRVFVADDYPVVTLGLSATLQNDDKKELVGVAHSTEEMFRLIPKTRPNVLLLDLNIPGSDFYKNIRQVRKETPWVKIIAFTAYHSAELVKSLFDEGVLGFLTKGASTEKIHAAIESVYLGERYICSIPFQPIEASNGAISEKAELPDDFRKRLRLSRREHEILGLITRGFTSQLIGKTLYISKHTVETHRKNILRKLDFNSSAELVKFAVQQGLV